MKKIIVFILCTLTILSCVACHSQTPNETPSTDTQSSRREPEHVATFSVSENEILFTPNETILTLFGLTQAEVDAEKAYCAENNIQFSITLDARVFNNINSSSRYTTLSQMNVRPESIVWKAAPSDDITSEFIQMKNRQAVYTYTATLKFGTQERKFIETYEYEKETDCRYSGDYKFQDLRPQVA